MMFVQFPTMAAFQAWNAAQVARLQLPRVGTNRATGAPAPYAQQTVSHSSPITHPANGTVIASYDTNADVTGVTTISDAEAMTQGYFPAADAPGA